MAPAQEDQTSEANGHANGVDSDMKEPKLYVPDRPAMSRSPPRIVIIGAGSRGRAYSKAVMSCCNGVVVAVAEPDDYKRQELGRDFIWGSGKPPAEGAEFTSWDEFIAYETKRRERVKNGEQGVPPGVDAAFVCVLDEMHREVVVALARLGAIHIMCEKPLATTLADCVEMYRALTVPGNEELIFSIGHVLRYSPHNIMLRKLLLEDRVIGDVLSVEHTEPVGWWHFAHSYVRGNWRRESTSAPTLLTKSCHDIDILLWLLCSPPSYSGPDGDFKPHLPSTVSSTGSLQYFKKSRKPVAAGSATNCLSCPVEESCKYSAKRIYVSNQLSGLGAGNTGWPVKIVMPDIEDHVKKHTAEKALLSKLAEDYDRSSMPDKDIKQRTWYGRCVYESDNDVCDEQVVTITWDEDPQSRQNGSASAPASQGLPDPLHGRGAKTATFHMVAHTKRICERYTHIYGVDGDLYADSQTITVEDFRTGKTHVYQPKMESLSGHGGGDNGLARQFVLAVDMVKNHGWPAARAQRELVGCTLEEVIRSHAMVFCAEGARVNKEVVDWPKWWAREVEGKLVS